MDYARTWSIAEPYILRPKEVDDSLGTESSMALRGPTLPLEAVEEEAYAQQPTHLGSVQRDSPLLREACHRMREPRCRCTMMGNLGVPCVYATSFRCLPLKDFLSPSDNILSLLWTRACLLATLWTRFASWTRLWWHCGRITFHHRARRWWWSLRDKFYK